MFLKDKVDTMLTDKEGKRNDGRGLQFRTMLVRSVGP